MITRHRLHGRNVYSWPVTEPELLVQRTKPHKNAGENGKPTFCWFLKVNTCRIGRLGTLCCDIPGTWRGMNHQGLGRYSRGRILANQLLLCRLHGCDRPSSRGSTTIDPGHAVVFTGACAGPQMKGVVELWQSRTCSSFDVANLPRIIVSWCNSRPEFRMISSKPSFKVV